ncbi:hypothetical protein GUJ93_ZPchr0010g9839 [Zizania palustris]|uniref:Uncharacterized protein n=1 Tax=Zizania palustris TaxID=103762 RepID=A0A8J5W7F8_ZIZPA|nr:hypothetical protein GUJ93_ZPchr0010g9839 [Zizania palustris]
MGTPTRRPADATARRRQGCVMGATGREQRPGEEQRHHRLPERGERGERVEQGLLERVKQRVRTMLLHNGEQATCR